MESLNRHHSVAFHDMFYSNYGLLVVFTYKYMWHYEVALYLLYFSVTTTPLLISIGVEISDEEAEKIFSCNDAVELLKTKLDLH